MGNYLEPEACITFAEEFIKMGFTNSNPTEYKVFAELLEKIDPVDKHKIFYNIALMYREKQT